MIFHVNMFTCTKYVHVYNLSNREYIMRTYLLSTPFWDYLYSHSTFDQHDQSNYWLTYSYKCLSVCNRITQQFFWCNHTNLYYSGLVHNYPSMRRTISHSSAYDTTREDPQDVHLGPYSPSEKGNRSTEDTWCIVRPDITSQQYFKLIIDNQLPNCMTSQIAN